MKLVVQINPKSWFSLVIINLFFFVGLLPSILAQDTDYIITGKVVDNKNLPLEGASIFVEPIKYYPDLWERFIEGVSSDSNGNFEKKIPKNNDSFGMKYFLFVSDGNMNGITTISPPFDWIRKYDRSFDGKLVKLENTDRINLGKVRVQFWFETIRLDYTNNAGKFEKINWRNVYIRIRNYKSTIVYFQSISTTDIKEYIDTKNKQIFITLPTGKWKVEILPPNAEITTKPIGTTSFFQVTKGIKNKVVSVNQSK